MRQWLNSRPYLVGLIAFTLVVIPGFLRVEIAVDDAQDAATKAKESAAESKVAAAKNTALIGCLTDYAAAMTDALQDRDAIAVLARGASVELWKTFRDLLVDPPAGDAGREVFLNALRTYLRTLAQVSRTADINPYPDLVGCLEGIGVNEPGFKLAAYSVPNRSYCLNRRVTIKGSRHDDIIHGTDGPDVIRTYGGSDLIVSGAGRDLICAGWGQDFINAGRGYDAARCGPGRDSAQQTEKRRNCE